MVKDSAIDQIKARSSSANEIDLKTSRPTQKGTRRFERQEHLHV